MARNQTIREIQKLYDVIDFVRSEHKELTERQMNLWLQNLDLTEADNARLQLLEHIMNIYLKGGQYEKNCI